MAGGSIDTTVPGLTRLVRASALLMAQGAAVGFAINTLWMWSRISEFATTNKILVSDRKIILACLIAPAILWVGGWLLFAAARSRPHQHLSSLESAAQRYSFIVVIAFLPVLFHPSLWRTRSLMYLITAGVATLVVWWSMRVTQKGIRNRQARRNESTQLERIAAYVAVAIPDRIKRNVPLVAVGMLILVVVAKGIWFEPSPALKASAEALKVTTLRQAMTLVGHGGWLGLPLAFSPVLRPTGEGHALLWTLVVSFAAFPLYAWSKRQLGVPLALLVAFAYLSMPMLRTLGRAELLPLSAAAAAFFWAVLEWERGRKRAALFATVLTVGVHEQAALWFTCLGIYLATSSSGRTRGRWLALASLAYFVAVAFIWLPYFDQTLYEQGFKGMWGRAPVGLVETTRVSLMNPAYVLSKWLELQGLTFWLALFVPFAFLPVCGRRWMLWAVPGIVFALVGPGRVPSLPVNAGVVAHFIVLGFVASVLTLARLRASAQTRPQATVAAVAWLFALAPTAYQFGGLWISAP